MVLRTATKETPKAPASRPRGLLIIDGQESEAPAELVDAVLAGWEKKQRADAAKLEVDAANEDLIERLPEPCSVVIAGVCRASFSVRELVKIADPDRLKGILGTRYPDLVKSVMTHKPEDRLIAMASDGDEPLQPAIAACLAISESEAITWRAEKPKQPQ